MEKFIEKLFYIYILASKRNGTLYVGFTSNLIKRIWEHKIGAAPGFTKKYHIKILVYYEQHFNAESAILREKQLNKWKRLWKLNLIERMNLTWRDLYNEII